MRVFAVYVFLIALTTAIHFPYHTDPVLPPSISKSAQSFYTQIYAPPVAERSEEPAADPNAAYTKAAAKAIEDEGIVPRITEVVRVFGLQNQRVLDVGAGTGYLQDVVANYVGLDISASARRYFHKPFVQASATDMPFHDGEFDVVWSIWVLEHVPTPEQALQEIRRVTKDGGIVYLFPAWECTPWAAQGYPVRPYSDFGIGGKLIKASMGVVNNPIYKNAYTLPTRLLRRAYANFTGSPTQYHYRQLTPNYDQYWMPDSDAINSLDSAETLLWFTSRGDECLNCSLNPVWGNSDLIIRVHKSANQGR